MKLSKQERIGLTIIAVIIIIAVGIFMFIVPGFEKIGTSTKSLDNKQAELNAALEKQATKDGLKDQIMEAYKAGENLADMFFSDVTTYQADMEFKAFVDQLQSNVFIDTYSIGTPGTTGLSTSFYTKEEITYPLKSYATSGQEPTEEELAAAARREILQNTLGSGQTVGSFTIEFTVSALDNEELLKFVDEVNKYEVEESGGKTRKAIMLNGYSFEFKEVSEKYQKLSDEILAEAEKAAQAELKKNFPDADFGESEPQGGQQEGEQPGEEDEEEKEKVSVSDTIYSLSATITFYSVTRMQDPTEQLEAQDGVAS